MVNMSVNFHNLSLVFSLERSAIMRPSQWESDIHSVSCGRGGSQVDAIRCSSEH